MQRKMKRLTEQEIREVLVAEYTALEERKTDLLCYINRLEEESKGENAREIQLNADLVAEKIRDQAELVRVWGRFFNKDFKTALDELIAFSKKVSQQVSA